MLQASIVKAWIDGKWFGAFAEACRWTRRQNGSVFRDLCGRLAKLQPFAHCVFVCLTGLSPKMFVCLFLSRYLAELAKFRIASPSVVLLRLKHLLDDFSGTNVDAAAALVESVGRFFVRLPGENAFNCSVVGCSMLLCYFGGGSAVFALAWWVLAMEMYWIFSSLARVAALLWESILWVMHLTLSAGYDLLNARDAAVWGGGRTGAQLLPLGCFGFLQSVFSVLNDMVPMLMASDPILFGKPSGRLSNDPSCNLR